MRKNRMMRLASTLLVLTLLTTCAISGTFAKYTTSATANDDARVAYWGFQASNSMDFENLFEVSYDSEHVKSQNGKDVIAPGTKGSVGFSFAYDEATKVNGADATMTGPEVAYTFTVAVTENCDALIKANENIQWKLTKTVGSGSASDVVAWGTWDGMIAAIKNLSGEAGGSKEYAANTLPSAFTSADEVYTICWQWLITGSENYEVDTDGDPGTPKEILNQDQYDTFMANAAEMDDCSIEITITATQVD